LDCHISNEINPQFISSPACAIARSPAAGKKNLYVACSLTSAPLLVHVSIIEHHTYFDRLSAVAKVASKSNGDSQPIRFLSLINGGIRGITAFERTFAA